MPEPIPQIEDIIGELSSDLENEDFYIVKEKEKEIVRYQKTDGPINFQVGLRQFVNHEGYETMAININFAYDIPDYMDQNQAEELVPDGTLMSVLLHDSICQLLTKGKSHKLREEGKHNFEIAAICNKKELNPENIRPFMKNIIMFYCDDIKHKYQMMQEVSIK